MYEPFNIVSPKDSEDLSIWEKFLNNIETVAVVVIEAGE